jgi:hypothetical protein
MVCRVPLVPSIDIRLISPAGPVGSRPKVSTTSSLDLLASPPTRRLGRPCRAIPFPFCAIPPLAARRLLWTPSLSTVAASLLQDVPISQTLTSMSPGPAFCLAHTTKTVSWTTLHSSVRMVAFSRRHGTPAHLGSSRTPAMTGRSLIIRTGFTLPRSRRGTSAHLRPCRTSTRTGFTPLGSTRQSGRRSAANEEQPRPFHRRPLSLRRLRDFSHAELDPSAAPQHVLPRPRRKARPQAAQGSSHVRRHELRPPLGVVRARVQIPTIKAHPGRYVHVPPTCARDRWGAPPCRQRRFAH